MGVQWASLITSTVEHCRVVMSSPFQKIGWSDAPVFFWSDSAVRRAVSVDQERFQGNRPAWEAKRDIWPTTRRRGLLMFVDVIFIVFLFPGARMKNFIEVELFEQTDPRWTM